MKKLLPLAIIALFVLMLSACSASELGIATDAPTESTAAGVLATLSPDANASYPPEPTAELPAETPIPTIDVTPVPEDWEGIFGGFLEAEYDKLYEAFFGGITGIGYIDLDLDGSPELLIFDAGASAAMGVQIFDIVDEEVVLVSANMLPVAEAYSGEYLSEVYVNANSFADFRLMEDKGTGLRFFSVSSSNGALDFNYTELIAFERGEKAVVPVSCFYKYVELNDEGIVTSSRFEKGGAPASEAEYERGMEALNSIVLDLGYEAAGVFIWESSGYQNGFDGFMAMANAARSRYIPAGDFEG